MLLDLDGTLLDSATGITQHLSLALASVGSTHPASTLRWCVGPPFQTVMPELGLGPDQVLAAITEYRRTYDPVATTLSRPFPGIVKLLDRLRNNGIRLAVATSKPESLARDIVVGNGLAEYFEVIGGADLERGRTGKAAVLESVLFRLGGSTSTGRSRPSPVADPAAGPTRTVMVGDRLHDVHGAAAHGLSTIGVSWGYAEPGELLRAGALCVVDTPEELCEVLLRGVAGAAA